MALSTMYAAMPGSPVTSLTSGIAANSTSMTLDDASVLPAAPNICVIGSDSTAEIVSYTSISGNVVSGLVRGLGGTTASAWASNTAVARNITSLDHDTFVTNITDLYANKAAIASPSFTGTPTAPTASSGTNTTQLATTAFAMGVVAYKFQGAFITDANEAPFGISSMSHSGDNAPFSSVQATIITLSNSDGQWKQQIAIPWYGTMRLALRYRSNSGTWSSWTEIS